MKQQKMFMRKENKQEKEKSIRRIKYHLLESKYNFYQYIKPHVFIYMHALIINTHTYSYYIASMQKTQYGREEDCLEVGIARGRRARV